MPAPFVSWAWNVTRPSAPTAGAWDGGTNVAPPARGAASPDPATRVILTWAGAVAAAKSPTRTARRGCIRRHRGAEVGPGVGRCTRRTRVRPGAPEARPAARPE